MRTNTISVLEALREEPMVIEQRALERMVAFLERAPSQIDFDSPKIQAAIEALRSTNPRAISGNVYIIPIQGVITQRANILTMMFCGTSCEFISRELAKAIEDPQVARIVLDIDSPGGFVGGTPELAEEILEARDKKPITAVANAQAASGAYWLASQASEFVASPSAEVGSIGVFTMHVDQSRAMEASGVKATYIKAGKYKTEGNPYEPLGDEAREAIQTRIDQYYDMFVKAVSRGRGVEISKVRNGFGQGRVLGTKDAIAAGMIDKEMTLTAAIGKRGKVIPDGGQLGPDTVPSMGRSSRFFSVPAKATRAEDDRQNNCQRCGHHITDHGAPDNSGECGRSGCDCRKYSDPKKAQAAKPAAKSEQDVCECGHKREDHHDAQAGGYCLECKCKRFEEKSKSQAQSPKAPKAAKVERDDDTCERESCAHSYQDHENGNGGCSKCSCSRFKDSPDNSRQSPKAAGDNDCMECGHPKSEHMNGSGECTEPGCDCDIYSDPEGDDEAKKTAASRKDHCSQCGAPDGESCDKCDECMEKQGKNSKAKAGPDSEADKCGNCGHRRLNHDQGTSKRCRIDDCDCKEFKYSEGKNSRAKKAASGAEQCGSCGYQLCDCGKCHNDECDKYTEPKDGCDYTKTQGRAKKVAGKPKAAERKPCPECRELRCEDCEKCHNPDCSRYARICDPEPEGKAKGLDDDTRRRRARALALQIKDDDEEVDGFGIPDDERCERSGCGHDYEEHDTDRGGEFEGCDKCDCKEFKR